MGVRLLAGHLWKQVRRFTVSYKMVLTGPAMSRLSSQSLAKPKTNCQLWLEELETLAPMPIHCIVAEEYPMPMTDETMGIIGGSLCRSLASLYGVDLDRVVCRFSRDRDAGIVYVNCGVRLSS